MKTKDGTSTRRFKAHIIGLDVDMQETAGGVAWALYDAQGARLDGDAEARDLGDAVAGVFRALEQYAPDAPPTPDPVPVLTAAQVDLIVGRVLAVLDARTV